MAAPNLDQLYECATKLTSVKDFAKVRILLIVLATETFNFNFLFDAARRGLQNHLGWRQGRQSDQAPGLAIHCAILHQVPSTGKRRVGRHPRPVRRRERWHPEAGDQGPPEPLQGYERVLAQDRRRVVSTFANRRHERDRRHPAFANGSLSTRRKGWDWIR